MTTYRAPMVVAGTVIGLAATLGFRSTPAALTMPIVAATLPATPTTLAPAPARPPARHASAPPRATGPRPRPSTTHTPAQPATPVTTPRTTPTTTPVPVTTTTAPVTTRTATGGLVNYYFGTLAVAVTVRGHTITQITVPSLSDSGNSYSQSVDAMAIPILTREAMAAQSANIQSVSGASYTSAGFARSLQSALASLGL